MRSVRKEMNHFKPCWNVTDEFGLCPFEHSLAAQLCFIWGIWAQFGIIYFLITSTCLHLSQGTAFPKRLNVRPVKIQIGLSIDADWSESSLPVWRGFGSLTTYILPCQDSHRTALIQRLIWIFARRTCNRIGNAITRLILAHDKHHENIPI